MLDKSDIVKKDLLKTLEQTLGVVSTACKAANVSRETFYKYKREDDNFAAAVDDIQNISLDFAESQLFKQIKAGNVTATIFYLKTKGKDRGYVERQEITGKDGSKLDVTFEIVGMNE